MLLFTLCGTRILLLSFGSLIYRRVSNRNVADFRFDFWTDNASFNPWKRNFLLISHRIVKLAKNDANRWVGVICHRKNIAMASNFLIRAVLLQSSRFRVTKKWTWKMDMLKRCIDVSSNEVSENSNQIFYYSHFRVIVPAGNTASFKERL